jgi:hypothetical protein
VEKPEGKKPLGRSRRRWENNNKMNLHEVGGGGMEWIGLAQDRDRWWALVNAAMNHRVPKNVADLTSSETCWLLKASVLWS